jgi:hypothetical protein
MMADLQQITFPSDPYLTFDGKTLHKKAFGRRGKITDDDAAVVAGLVKDEFIPGESDRLIQRMVNIRSIFKRRIEHYAQLCCVENARRIQMTNSRDGSHVETYNHIMEELESNPRMSNFQNWYYIYYKDFEVKSSGKKDAESKIMKELKITYPDGSTTRGCIGELLNEVISKLLENIQKRSRAKQQLHLTKSSPRGGGSRRSNGTYYIIRSNENGKMVDADEYNVSMLIFQRIYCAIHSQFVGCHPSK